jgi:hypothetical protein
MPASIDAPKLKNLCLALDAVANLDDASAALLAGRLRTVLGGPR